MIKTEKGYTEIRGKMVDLLTDFSVITHRLRETFLKDLEEEEVDELLTHAFEQGKMSADDVREQAMKGLEKADLETLVDILKEVLKHE